jgi:hypothetical protein
VVEGSQHLGVAKFLYMFIPVQSMMLPLDPFALLCIVCIVKGKKCLLEIIIIVLSQDKHPNNVAIEHV